MRHIILLILVMTPAVAFSAPPTLNFSDLISGPSSGLEDGLGAGSIVTIWGNDLGSSQGSSSITIGGEAPAHIYYWKNADGMLPSGPADLHTSHGIQEVAFSIPSSLSNGLHSIQVTVNGATSNTLPFTVRPGNIFHAKTTGNANNNGSFDAPWLSWMQGGLHGMSSGDIVYLHDGVTDIAPDKNVISGKTGSLSMQYGIVSYPGARYLMQGADACVDMYHSDSFTISKATCKAGYFDEPSQTSTTILGKHGGTGIEGAANGRLIANEITDIPGKCSSGYAGAIVASCGGSNCDPISNLKVLGNYIHDWGCPQTSHFEHTTYMSIRNNGYTDVEPWEMGWNHLRDNHAKYGIHNYDETFSSEPNQCGSPRGTVKLHDNYIINQKGPGISIGSRAGTGADCWDSGQFEIYNNIIIEAGKGPADENGSDTCGIRIRDRGMSVPVNIFNNSIYGFGDDSLGATAGICIYETNNSGRLTATISNNIVYDTRGGNYTQINEIIYPNISGSNNTWFSNAGTSNDTVDSRLTNNIFQEPESLVPDTNNGNSSASPTILLIE